MLVMSGLTTTAHLVENFKMRDAGVVNGTPAVTPFTVIEYSLHDSNPLNVFRVSLPEGVAALKLVTGRFL